MCVYRLLLLYFCHWAMVCSGLAFQGLSTEEVNAHQYPPSIQWIDIEGYKARFNNMPPMNVGFDLDGAILFATAIVEKHCPNCTSEKFLEKQATMYQKMNCDDVRYTLPKRIGKTLIAYHQARGDKLYFITARGSSPCVDAGYSINDWIKETFEIKQMNPVVFTKTDFGRGSKTSWLKERNLAVYLGDSDSDIQAAIDAGILGIRIMRPGNSLNRSGNNIGKFGEMVIRRSDI
ncbi:MAG: hypothetical protein OXE99_10825 [Cellvibrionales bacterium]|nr:hypothetical protein [Cellvibrionales bacterium]